MATGMFLIVPCHGKLCNVNKCLNGTIKSFTELISLLQARLGIVLVGFYGLGRLLTD